MAAVSRRAEGEVRAYARLDLAGVEWRRGRRPRAERWIRSLGLVTSGLVIGPFPNDNGAAYDQVLPPEKAALAGVGPDAAKAVAGKDRPVRWRVLPKVFPLGYVDLSSLVSPSSQVALYVRVVLEAPKDLGAVLRLGTPGATKVWVDGKPVHADPGDHPPRFDQAAVPVVLHAGENPVLLKITQQQGMLGYYLRITDADGNRLRGVTVVDPKTDLDAGTAAAQGAAAKAGPEAGKHSATVAAAEPPAKARTRRHPVTAPTPSGSSTSSSPGPRPTPGTPRTSGTPPRPSTTSSPSTGPTGRTSPRPRPPRRWPIPRTRPRRATPCWWPATRTTPTGGAWPCCGR